MIDEDQQLATPSPGEDSSPSGELPETEKPVTEGDTPVEEDWELQVAQAYQNAPSQSPSTTHDSLLSSESSAGVSQALEFLKLELEQATEEKKALKAQLDAISAQTGAIIEDLKTQNLRLAADFDNFRKRTQKEKEDLDLQSKCSTIMELLPVIDNFERARSQIKPQNDGEMNVHKSYQSVYKQMVDCLKRIGVSPMRPEGEPFDPNFHEAVMREPTSEYEEGTIIEELVRGYMLGERVLRHALVKVATAPELTDESEEPTTEPG